MIDEKRPQFMHWKAKTCCTEDFYLEEVLGMRNRDYKRVSAKVCQEE